MLQLGTILQGRYRVIRSLSQGGFSQTYEVKDGEATKVLKVLIENYPKAVDLLQREARVLSQLNYPGVPKVEPDAFFVLHPKNSAEPLHCLVMEKIPGLDLKQWLANRQYQPINQEQALDWLRQLSEILGQLHQQSFFHRDIKPSNIILRPDGQLVLIDFGCVRQITETYLQKSQDSETGTCLHSLGYAPLEQIDGKAAPQSDFFALGRTLVHLLTGKPPYEFSSDPSTGQLRWRKDAPHISESLANLIDWMMEPFPGRRPQTTRVILQVLAAMRQQKASRWVEFSLGGLWSGVATGILIGARLLGGLQGMELKAFDQMMQWRPLEGPDERLLLVEVTQADIEDLGNELPLPDQILLQLLQKLDEYQPQVIGLDLYQNGPKRAGRSELIQYLQQQQHIVPICSHPNPHSPWGVAPLPKIPAKQLGFADVVLNPNDNDIVRRHLLSATPEAHSSCPASYALSTQLALLYLEAQGYQLDFPTVDTWQLHKADTTLHFYVLQTHRGFYPQPEMARGHQILLNYRRLNSFEQIVDKSNQVSLTAILNDQMSPDQIKGKIVLVGVTDPAIQDKFNTPYNQKIRGVILHAMMVSQLISAVEEGRPLLQFWPLWGDMLWMFIWSGVGVMLTWRLQTDKLTLMRSQLYWGFASAALIINLSGVCFLLLLLKGVVLPFVPSALAYVVAGGGMMLYKQFQVKDYRFPPHLNGAKTLFGKTTG